MTPDEFEMWKESSIYFEGLDLTPVKNENGDFKLPVSINGVRLNCCYYDQYSNKFVNFTFVNFKYRGNDIALMMFPNGNLAIAGLYEYNSEEQFDFYIKESGLDLFIEKGQDVTELPGFPTLFSIERDYNSDEMIPVLRLIKE